MLAGKWVPVNMRDRKKMRDLVEHHGNFTTVAKLIGCAELTLKKWMDSDLESSFRSGAKDKLKMLVKAMTAPPKKKKKAESEPQLVGPLVSDIRETVFQDLKITEGPKWLSEMIELRDALNTVIGMFEGPTA